MCNIWSSLNWLMNTIQMLNGKCVWTSPFQTHLTDACLGTFGQLKCCTNHFYYYTRPKILSLWIGTNRYVHSNLKLIRRYSPKSFTWLITEVNKIIRCLGEKGLHPDLVRRECGQCFQTREVFRCHGVRSEPSCRKNFERKRGLLFSNKSLSIPFFQSNYQCI